MRELQRLTTEYIEAEDRIRIVGEVTSEKSVVMWLNQRLLIRLLPHLFGWLDKQTESSIPLEIAQSFAQVEATGELSVQAPVQHTPQSQEWLVSAVDITPIDSTVSLIFRSGAGQEEKLALQPIALRQWLAIIYSLWSAAQWPSDVWPEWITSEKQETESVEPSKLH